MMPFFVRGTQAPGRQRSLILAPILLAFTVAAGPLAWAQRNPAERLHNDQFRSGEDVLRAFAPVSKATRNSIVKFNVDGETVSLGVVVEATGLVLTKNSELKKGPLTAWLANEREVPAEMLAADEVADVALVRVHTPGLKAISWVDDPAVIGQWAITPGIADTPHAVGIVSTLARKIRPARAFIGVQFDLNSAQPKIGSLMTGLGAEKAGLKPGDVILSINDAGVTNREQVVEIVRDFRDGETLRVRVQRGKEEIATEVQLMHLAAEDSRFGADRRTERLTGKLSVRAEGFEQAIEHDSVLPPWLCGGPLVNLDGKAFGLNIARAGRVSTYALPATLVKRITAELKERAGLASEMRLRPVSRNPRNN